MGKVTGFIEIHRKKPPTRDVAERLRDWNEVYLPYPDSALKDQAARWPSSRVWAITAAST